MPVLMVGTTELDMAEVKAPTSMSWGLQDISSSDAGRVEDANNTMWKHRTSQKRKLSLSWSNPTLAEASAILKAFNPEYVFARFLDPMQGGFMTRQFYVGDRSSPFRMIDLDGDGTVLTTVSFDLIER